MKNSKMSNCRVCNLPVAKSANKCPHCGARNPNKSENALVTVSLVLVISLVIILVVAICIGISSDDAGTSTDSGSSSAQTQTPEDDPVQYIEVTAPELWDAYQGNEVNADLLYRDKLLAVTGTITDIGKDVLTDAPCVSLDIDSSYNLYPIQCFFQKNGNETEQIAALSKGDAVTIYGKCTGVSLVNVQLTKCTLVP